MTPSNCSRNRSGYGPYLPNGRYGPMNFHWSLASCLRVTRLCGGNLRSGNGQPAADACEHTTTAQVPAKISYTTRRDCTGKGRSEPGGGVVLTSEFCDPRLP